MSHSSQPTDSFYERHKGKARRIFREALQPKVKQTPQVTAIKRKKPLSRLALDEGPKPPLGIRHAVKRQSFEARRRMDAFNSAQTRSKPAERYRPKLPKSSAERREWLKQSFQNGNSRRMKL